MRFSLIRQVDIRVNDIFHMILPLEVLLCFVLFITVQYVVNAVLVGWTDQLQGHPSKDF